MENVTKRDSTYNVTGINSQDHLTLRKNLTDDSRGTKEEKMLTLAPERYTAGFHMVAKVILWCI